MTIKKFAVASIGLILAGILILPAPARAVEVKIRLHGGYSYFIFGDLNKGSEGFANMWGEALTMSGWTRSGSFKKAQLGPSFGGDLVLMFSPVIGIGFGSEYLRASKSSTIGFAQGAGSVQIIPTAEASAVPLNASLFLSFSGGAGVHVNLYAGTGYYMAKMLSSWRLQEGADFLQYESTAKSNQWGFHAGLGFEFDLSPNVALFIEARGRYAKLGGFSGDVIISSAGGVLAQESGDLYYSENQGFVTAFYPILAVSPTMPTPDATTRNVREGKIDFSGGTALGGIVFKF